MKYSGLGRTRSDSFFSNTCLIQWTALITLVASLLCLAGCAGLSTGSNSSTNSTGSLALSPILTPAVVGVSYTSTLSVSGGTAPYAFTTASGTLPGGLALSGATGTISGTPTQAATFSFSISVSDAKSLSAKQSYQVVVSNAGTISVTVSPSSATVVSGTTKQFTALVSNSSNVAVTWTASPGTVSSSGLYTAPTVSTNTNATVTATSVADHTKFGTAAVTVTPAAAPVLSITTTSLSSATAGTSYSSALSATGGKSPYTWTLSSGTLPSGITVQSAGTVSGTTTQTGQFSFTVQASDSSSPKQTATKSFTLSVNASTGGGILAPTTLFGFTDTATEQENFPTASYGMQRFWDSPPLQWPSINTASGVFDFTQLDSTLAQGYSSGVMVGMYTLARTPPWASSNPSDASCHFTDASSGGGMGECDAPNDLNSDGTGANAIWKAWITAIAGHVNDATYLKTHSHIKYWEIWNEPDNQPYWSGSIAQLARLTEDANCIITGRGVIHESGNGTATPCTAKAIDATAQIVMSSGHARTGGALTYAQNQLYCNASPSGYELPCPNPANAIATAVDIINFHMKPGNETGNTCPAPTPCTPESAMQMYVSNIHGMLQSAELAKPLWNGEGAYAKDGFTDAYTDPDMAASFMARFYLLNWSLNISGMAWYDWDQLVTQPVSVQTAYQQTYNWLAPATLSTPCAANGNVWSCSITLSGKQYLIMWDASQSCANGSCTTSNQTVASQWTQYQDMTTASTAVTISGHVVPVSIKPVVLH